MEDIEMGAYYTLGITEKFTAKTDAVLSKDNWLRILNERFDISLYDITIDDKSVSAELKENVIKDNIDDFYIKLKNITGHRRIDYYYEEHGKNVNDYPSDRSRFSFFDNEKNQIRMQIDFIFLFTEGKVSSEEFDAEPMLMNWLFRHSDFGNPLAGTIISTIV
jgi:hypothetical protein